MTTNHFDEAPRRIVLLGCGPMGAAAVSQVDPVGLGISQVIALPTLNAHTGLVDIQFMTKNADLVLITGELTELSNTTMLSTLRQALAPKGSWLGFLIQADPATPQTTLNLDNAVIWPSTEASSALFALQRWLELIARNVTEIEGSMLIYFDLADLLTVVCPTTQSTCRSYLGWGSAEQGNEQGQDRAEQATENALQHLAQQGVDLSSMKYGIVAIFSTSALSNLSEFRRATKTFLFAQPEMDTVRYSLGYDETLGNEIAVSILVVLNP